MAHAGSDWLILIAAGGETIKNPVSTRNAALRNISLNFLPPKSRNGKARSRQVAFHSARGRTHALYVSLVRSPRTTRYARDRRTQACSGLTAGRELQGAQTRRLYGGSIMSLVIKNLDAPLGAEISGRDLSKPIAPNEVKTIEDVWRERLVVVFHDQKLSDPQLIAFSKNFGELDPPGPNPYGESFLKDHPELNVIPNVVENGKPIGNLGDGEAVWHADMTYVEVPPKAAMLHSLEVPPPEAGGNTYFANMLAAYEALPAELKEAAKDKVAVHDASRNSAGMLRKGYKEVADVRETVGAHHPLVRTERDTGRKALFLGRRPNAYVLGLRVPDSEALLDALWAHATKPEFAMCHVWQVGDVLMWNNLSVMHRRDPFDETARRIMHRTQIKGTARIARSSVKSRCGKCVCR